MISTQFMLLIRQRNLPVVWFKNMMNLLDRLFSYHNTKCKTIERLHSSLAEADFRRAKKLYCSPPALPPSPTVISTVLLLPNFFCPVLRPSFLICLCPVHIQCHILNSCQCSWWHYIIIAWIIGIYFPPPMLSFLGVTMTYCPQSSHKVHYLAKIHAIHQVICHQIHSYSFSFTATSESLLILMSWITLLTIERILCTCLLFHISTKL